MGPHLACGIRGRRIVTNIHEARSILEYCDAMERRVSMLPVDLEKAFDPVSCEILFSMLNHISLGFVFCGDVRKAYANCATTLLVNKGESERMFLSSVRQACPLSPLIFFFLFLYSRTV